MALDITMFVGCLALMLWASDLLAKGLDRLGSKLHFSEELLGVITALGADSPEISSAIVALISNKRDLGIGIVLGSNLFNLAALLGLGAVVAGYVRAASAATIFNGAVALAVTAVSAGLIAGVLSPTIATAIVLLIISPYLYLLAVAPRRIRQMPLPSWWKQFLLAARSEEKARRREIGEETRQDEAAKRVAKRKTDERSWTPAVLVLPALALIVLGSIGVVRYATAISEGWLPEAILGTFVLASLTGLPNAFTAVRIASRMRKKGFRIHVSRSDQKLLRTETLYTRLFGLGYTFEVPLSDRIDTLESLFQHPARHGKGAAVITETFNSNTINIVVGLLLPALVFGETSPNRLIILDLSWLIFMTGIAVILSAQSAKLTRNQGLILLGLYLAFAASWTVLFLRG